EQHTRLTSLLQSTTPATQGFSYAGTSEAKNAYSDAARAELDGVFAQLSWSRTKSAEEQIYASAKGTLLVNNEQQGLANIGGPAIYALSGPLGIGIRGIAAANGAAQIGYGLGQALEGDSWNAAGNIVLGSLALVGGLSTTKAFSSGSGVRGAADSVETGAGAKGTTSVPAWTSSEGPYSGKLAGDYPATVPATWQVADDVGGFGGKLDAKSLELSGQKLPSALPDNLTGYANPKDIRFTQDSVSNTFKDGQTLQSTIDGLKSGKISPDDLPPIRVFEKDGMIYSLDNRRLLAASEAGVPIKVVPATPAEVAKEGWKMTTPNNGLIICVRGVCK
ncbi:hypothetical protein, partial [Pseudomonas syringae]